MRARMRFWWSHWSAVCLLAAINSYQLQALPKKLINWWKYLRNCCDKSDTKCYTHTAYTCAILRPVYLCGQRLSYLSSWVLLVSFGLILFGSDDPSINAIELESVAIDMIDHQYWWQWFVSSGYQSSITCVIASASAEPSLVPPIVSSHSAHPTHRLSFSQSQAGVKCCA